MNYFIHLRTHLSFASATFDLFYIYIFFDICKPIILRRGRRAKANLDKVKDKEKKKYLEGSPEDLLVTISASSRPSETNLAAMVPILCSFAKKEVL